ncbi:hypothetical protein AAHA92_32361 [Salvia divinorum]|uniref:Uncharacterized protein n=1 Tax=Salvia divinorum TaxID=28513 RepID=A0ABD1FKY7_SALDI
MSAYENVVAGKVEAEGQIFRCEERRHQKEKEAHGKKYPIVYAAGNDHRQMKTMRWYQITRMTEDATWNSGKKSSWGDLQRLL